MSEFILSSRDVIFLLWKDSKKVTCPAGNFACRTGMCIPHSWVCDGFADCYDGKDENGCTNGTLVCRYYRGSGYYRPTIEIVWNFDWW